MKAETPDLPPDVTACHAVILELSTRVEKLNRLNESLQHQMEKLLRARYGRSSEKSDAAQLRLFAPELIEDPLPKAEESSAEKKPAKDRKGHGRRHLPTNLPEETRVIDVPEADKFCVPCNTPKTKIGEERSEQLEFVPASLKKVVTVRPKYACKKCEEGVTIADKPRQPIEKGKAGPGLLAHVVTSKYNDHLPLNRQEAIFERIPRSTQCDWMRGCANLLEPLY